MGTAAEGGGVHTHTHTHTHTTYTFTVPPGILPVPVPRQQTGTWKMPEAEGLETSLRDTHPGSFGSFLEFLKAQVKGPRPPGGAQKNLSAPLAAGTQPGSGEAAEPHSSRASPGPSPAAPQEAPPKTKRCGFSPRLKSTASVFSPPPPESESDSVSPNKPPINQPRDRLLRSSADLGD